MEFLIERSGGFEWFSGERSIGEEVGFIEDFPRIWIRFCRSVEVCGSCIVNLLAKEDFFRSRRGWSICAKLPNRKRKLLEAGRRKVACTVVKCVEKWFLH